MTFLPMSLPEKAAILLSEDDDPTFSVIIGITLLLTIIMYPIWSFASIFGFMLLIGEISVGVQ